MEQVKALNALEPFLALSKTATSPRAAADLITRATSAPGTYVFAELLDAPNIRALASAGPEHAAHLALLRIFSHGTYADYAAAAPGTLPPLGEAQALKLRQLSLLTLARGAPGRRAAALSYDALLRDLGLGASARALEDTVISAVYAGLLTAQLDPARRAVHVTAVAPLRDLAPGDLPRLADALDAWSARCAATLAGLEDRVRAIRAEAARRALERRSWDATVRAVIDEEKNGGGGGGGGGGDGGGPAAPGPGRKQGGKGGGGGRFGKRAIEKAAEEPDDEAMDVDDEDNDVAEGGKKRASRRKL